MNILDFLKSTYDLYPAVFNIPLKETGALYKELCRAEDVGFEYYEVVSNRSSTRIQNILCLFCKHSDVQRIARASRNGSDMLVNYFNLIWQYDMHTELSLFFARWTGLGFEPYDPRKDL